MKKKLVIPAIIAIIVLGLFIALTIISRVYQGGEIPIQIMGALLGAIITAFITMILLLGQSQAEELKERNVRVFEEKTNRYNKFIENLWKIWEDRKVTLEELNELMKSISKDIILYTNKNTVNNILKSLTVIAKYAGKDQTEEDDKKKIQAQVFEIVNQLAKEMNLGGEISPEMQTKLDSLEKSILPYLNIKSYKAQLLADINRLLSEQTECPLNNAHYDYWFDGYYIFINIENSPVRMIVGPTAKSNPDSSTLLGFFIDYYQYPKFYGFRDASRGWRKDFLRGYWLNPIDVVDFNNNESVMKFENDYQCNEESDKPADRIMSKVLEFYNQWNYDGKTVEDISQECV